MINIIISLVCISIVLLPYVLVKSEDELDLNFTYILTTVISVVLSILPIYLYSQEYMLSTVSGGLIIYIVFITTIYTIGSNNGLDPKYFNVSITSKKLAVVSLDIKRYNILNDAKINHMRENIPKSEFRLADKILRFYKTGVYLMPILIILSLGTGIWLTFNQNIFNTLDLNFGYILISYIILLIIHEFGHLITMSADKDLNPKSIGTMILFLLPIAMFVEDEVEDLESSIVISAGIFNNILIFPFIIIGYSVTGHILFTMMFLVNLILIVFNTYPVLYTDGGQFLMLNAYNNKYIIPTVCLIIAFTGFSFIMPPFNIFYIYGFILIYVSYEMLSI